MNDPVMMYLTERGLYQDGLHSLTADDVRELIVGYLKLKPDQKADKLSDNHDFSNPIEK